MLTKVEGRSNLNPINCGCRVLLFPLIFVVVVSLICGLLGFIPDRLAVQSVTVTVQDKYTKRYGQNESDRYVFEILYDNGDVEVVQNTDTLWWGKFNSADFYANIEKGKKYNITLAGWRIPIFSSFRNIVSYTPISGQ